ncbi:MAG: hypothetical protein DRJ05_18280 [Bacteroidetes bacterium]|nr:MAG: hypothetical protein DRJ05_18280 [Bacteroidota bacterium]
MKFCFKKGKCFKYGLTLPIFTAKVHNNILLSKFIAKYFKIITDIKKLNNLLKFIFEKQSYSILLRANFKKLFAYGKKEI